LHLRVQLRLHDRRYLTGFAGRGLTRREIQSLRFRYTTDNWQSSGEVLSRPKHDEEWGLVADFEDICVLPRSGRLEGFLYVKGPGVEVCIYETARHGGYTFALPDRRELSNIIKRQTGTIRRQGATEAQRYFCLAQRFAKDCQRIHQTGLVPRSKNDERLSGRPAEVH
jgi:hypothetical protein